MKTNIKDYLHLYLGCDVRVKGWKYRSKFIELHQDGILVKDSFTTKIYFGGFDVILRPPNDMTEEEALELGKRLYSGVIIGNPYLRDGLWHVPYGFSLDNFWTIDGKAFNQHQVIYLLSKRFDLFGLIEAGLAIDSTTINQQP
jgi:hypothetical protein